MSNNLGLPEPSGVPQFVALGPNGGAVGIQVAGNVPSGGLSFIQLGYGGPYIMSGSNATPAGFSNAPAGSLFISQAAASGVRLWSASAPSSNGWNAWTVLSSA